MDQIINTINELRGFAAQHMTPQVLDAATAVAGALLVGGIILCVLGAKLARPALTMLFAAAGAIGASMLELNNDSIRIVALALGAIVGGTIGFTLFRLWVGSAAALVFAALTIGFLAHDQILSAVERVDGSTYYYRASDQQPEFVLPSPAEQSQYAHITVADFSKEVWSEIEQADPSAASRWQWTALAVGGVSLVLGLLLPRLILILATSIFGMALVLGGAAYLIDTFWPERLAQVSQNQQLFLGLIFGGLLLSMILQAQLTRKPRQAPTAKSY